MRLQPQPIAPVPTETARVAHAAFPKKKSVYMLMRDALGVFYTDATFAALYPRRGQPAFAPWRLALVTVMQYVEGLTDRQAADAVRSRLDWKYALSLELTDPGFDASILCEFRTRLVAGNAEQLLFETMLTVFKERGLLKAGGTQRTDSTHVLAAVRVLSRLETVGETLRAALNSLAIVAPQWLTLQVTQEWFDRYGARIDEYHLPTTEKARDAYARQTGADGIHLLTALYAETAPAHLREIEAVEVLRQTWIAHYYYEADSLRWRAAHERPPSHQRIHSPYDTDADYTTKRATTWTGDKVHLTETCDRTQPHLITHVETTKATVTDVERTADIQDALRHKALQPATHIVDRGYIDADLLVASETQPGPTLLGPLRADPSWQAVAGSPFSNAHFTIDWTAKTMTCPTGKTSIQWQPSQDTHGADVIRVKFSRTDCGPCVSRPLCTRSAGKQRELTVRTQQHYETMQRIRLRETTAEFKAVYRLRAGIEGTLSQGVRAFGMRRSRYRGVQKTHIGHLATAAAMNVVRVVAWLEGGETAKPARKPSHFAALARASVP